MNGEALLLAAATAHGWQTTFVGPYTLMFARWDERLTVRAATGGVVHSAAHVLPGWYHPDPVRRHLLPLWTLWECEAGDPDPIAAVLHQLRAPATEPKAKPAHWRPVSEPRTDKRTLAVPRARRTA